MKMHFTVMLLLVAVPPVTKKNQSATTLESGSNHSVNEQEAQLMLTTGSTRLLAVSRARAISDGTLT